jgi:hypothetical protein
MRGFNIYIIFFVSVLLFSCSKEAFELEESKGFVQLGFEQYEDESADLKKANITVTPSKVSITFKNKSTKANQTLVIPVNIGEDRDYLTDPIELEPGHYEVIFFSVLDEYDNVISLMPLNGSKWAKKIDSQISLEVKVLPQGRFLLLPKVVCIDGADPSDFGYSKFSFNVVSIIDFNITTMAYDKAKQAFDFIDARELILDSNTGDTLYTGTIEKGTNQIKVRDGIEEYMLLTTKQGFQPDTLLISAEELKALKGTPTTILLSEI